MIDYSQVTGKAWNKEYTYLRFEPMNAFARTFSQYVYVSQTSSALWSLRSQSNIWYGMTAHTSKIWLILFVPTYIVYIYAWKSDLHALHKGLYWLDVLVFQFWADCEQSFIYCFWHLIRRLSVLEVPQSDQVENIERALRKIRLPKPQTATKVRAGQEASCVGRRACYRYIMVV